MARTKAQIIDIDNVKGGLDMSDHTIIADNALALATNFFYNNDQMLQTRYGQKNWGQPVPDTASLIHNCDSTTANGTWAATDDATALSASTTTVKRGSASLLFNINVAGSANNFATLTNPSFTIVDITLVKGYVGFWIFVPTGGKTNLTDCRLRLGSDASNYYEFTIQPSALTENQWNFVPLAFSGASTTGTPVDTGIDYALFRVNYTASYVNQTGWAIDDIVCYSSSATKPQMSIFWFGSSKASTNFPRYLIVNVGTNLMEWDETTGYWTRVRGGLTEGTRFSMTAYKNVMYFTNGTDNFFAYDGVNTVDKTGANTYKGKYVLMANDVGYILGDPTAPSTLGYTASVPSNLDTFPNALVLDEDSSDGKGTGLINLGPIVVASKDRKIYQINIATPSRQQLDYSDGVTSHRSLIRVENEVFLLNQKGVFSLAQREATIGSLRADPISAQLQPLLDDVKNKDIAAAIYVNKFNNVYLALDTNEDGINESCLVFSVLTKKWTTYTGVTANQFCYYQDKNGDFHLLYANAAAGQVMEMETGFNDNGVLITSEGQTKSFHLNQPATLKTWEMIEIEGYISQTGQMDITAIIDDSYTTPVASVLGTTYYQASYGSYTLGTSPLGTTTLGGSASATNNSITLYPFKIRIPIEYTGSRLQIDFLIKKLNTVAIFQKFTLYPKGEPIQTFEAAYIA